jgi:dihydroorotate dehydrogenase
LRTRATEVITVLARHLRGALPIIGVGGILRGDDAVEKLQAGASLVQIYTGLIYRGPALVGECRRAILDWRRRSSAAEPSQPTRARKAGATRG